MQLFNLRWYHLPDWNRDIFLWWETTLVSSLFCCSACRRGERALTELWVDPDWKNREQQFSLDPRLASSNNDEILIHESISLLLFTLWLFWSFWIWLLKLNKSWHNCSKAKHFQQQMKSSTFLQPHWIHHHVLLMFSFQPMLLLNSFKFLSDKRTYIK